MLMIRFIVIIKLIIRIIVIIIILLAPPALFQGQAGLLADHGAVSHLKELENKQCFK